MAENSKRSASRGQGQKFQKGQSGNPGGRPRGSKDKRTELRALFQLHAKDLIEKAAELGKSGDVAALRLCIERLVPPLKEDPVVIDGLSTGTLTERSERVVAAMGRGEIAPDQAHSVLQALAVQARIIELDELEKRVKRLEQHVPA